MATDLASGASPRSRIRATERKRIRAATHPAYRPDIDGLRALAVVPVVLAHAHVWGFAGGFVGVDVFFVISGYLITGILVRDLAIGRHTIAEFYRRRVLRIFPVLFAVLAATTIFACLSMLPVELVRFARSLGSTALFSSNVLFYSESGYFDAVSETKPLLHTWSLSVEEQFYILWPVVLAWVGSHRPTLLKFTIAAICVVSFLASAILISRDASATFYLLPSRAWELGLGAMLAVTGNPVNRRWLNDVLGLLGLAGIVASIWLLNQSVSFPGPAAVMPCVGALLLTATGPKGTIASRLLSLPPAVFIGKISYSLYMWHWPVVVFSNVYLLRSTTEPAVQFAQVFLSFVLAVLSWRYIECPFRQGVSHWRTRSVLLGGLVAIMAFLIIAGTLLALRGLPGRYSQDQQRIAAYLDMDVEKAYRRGLCFRTTPGSVPEPECLVPKTGRPVVLLLGDSHAAQFWPGFDKRESDFEVLQATMAGCRPVIHDSPENTCRQFFNRMLLEWVPHHRPALVVLAGKWQPGDMTRLRATLDDLVLLRQKTLLVGPIPQYASEVPRLIAMALKKEDPGLLRRSQLELPFALDERMRDVARRSGVPYLSLIDMLCQNRNCRTLAGPLVPLQFDYGHLTEEGSALLVGRMSPRIDQELGSSGQQGRLLRPSPMKDVR